MARRDAEGNEVIITVPLRRLLTGVPRTKRAAASVPRIKRYVRRHVPSTWLDAVASEADPDGKLWIDDSLNMTIWRRGREHVAGPAEWEEPKGGGPPRLTKRTSVRYGSVLKVRVFFNEDPEDGSDPRLELTLPGVEHLTRQEKRDKRREKGKDDEEEEGEGQAEDEEVSDDMEEEEASDEEDDEDEEDEEPEPAKPSKGRPRKKSTKEEGED